MLTQLQKHFACAGSLAQRAVSIAQPGPGRNPTDATACPVPFIFQAQEFFSGSVQYFKRALVKSKHAQCISPGLQTQCVAGEMHCACLDFTRARLKYWTLPEK